MKIISAHEHVKARVVESMRADEDVTFFVTSRKSGMVVRDATTREIRFYLAAQYGLSHVQPVTVGPFQVEAQIGKDALAQLGAL